MKKNYMLLKTILTDGHYTSEDFLMVECRDDSQQPSPTPTPEPTANIELNSANNWTYRFNNFLVIRFIPSSSDQNQYVFKLPKLSDGLLPQLGQPAPIPSSSSVIIGSDKIGDLLFINSYFNKPIVLAIGTSQYNSTTNIGQIIF